MATQLEWPTAGPEMVAIEVIANGQRGNRTPDTRIFSARTSRHNPLHVAALPGVPARHATLLLPTPLHLSARVVAAACARHDRPLGLDF